jgi:hypothetical protein
MSYPVKVELFKNGHLLLALMAQNADDLRCSIEMDTGIGWLDASPLFQKMLLKGADHISETIRVCHSYEKWGGLQQEVVKIKVRLQLVKEA